MFHVYVDKQLKSIMTNDMNLRTTHNNHVTIMIYVYKQLKSIMSVKKKLSQLCPVCKTLTLDTK